MWLFRPYRRVYSYPLKQAAEIAAQTVKAVVKEHSKAFDDILWVLFDATTKAVYDDAIGKVS